MHCSLFGVYWYPFVKGFYIGQIGDERFDSSLLGVHWGIQVDEEEEQMYRTLSLDILYITLIRNTFLSIFRRDDKEGEDEKE